MKARAFVLAAGVLACVASLHDASASCGAAAPVRVWPHRPTAAPTNVRVVVTRTADATAKALSLVTAPARGAGARMPVATKTSAWTTRELERIELVPEASLAPTSGYEIWAGDRLIGAFATGAGPDTTPPSWAGLREGRLYAKPKGNKILLVDLTGCGSDLVTLWTDALATDDQAGEGDIRYALWASPPKDAIDYGKRPLSWVAVDVERAKDGMRAGQKPTWMLTFGNFEGPEPESLELPAGRPLKIGVRAIDLAGNASAPSELVLK